MVPNVKLETNSRHRKRARVDPRLTPFERRHDQNFQTAGTYHQCLRVPWYTSGLALVPVDVESTHPRRSVLVPKIKVSLIITGTTYTVACSLGHHLSPGWDSFSPSKHISAQYLLSENGNIHLKSVAARRFELRVVDESQVYIRS